MVPYNDGLTFNHRNGVGFYGKYGNGEFDSNWNF